MHRTRSRKSVICALAALSALVLPSSLSANDGRVTKSLAPHLLKAKAQTRILRHDDGVASRACLKKTFSAVSVVTKPSSKTASRSNGKVYQERKWQEQWVLDRCGTEIGYRVFFTDVGDGGAYFAFTQTD